MSNNKSKNVKIPIELAELIQKRAPDVPPGETLLQISKDYEKLEALAKCLDKNVDLSKGVFDAVASYIENGKQRIEGINKSIDEMKAMLQTLEKFFIMVKK